MDFLLTQPEVDKDKIAITGHSRGGKAVILAGATDERIALTAPNNSGTGGAASFRFQTAESEPLRNITRNFPDVVLAEAEGVRGSRERIAVRPAQPQGGHRAGALLTTEALADFHANPSGTWLTHRAAREVYTFLGTRTASPSTSAPAATSTASKVFLRCSISRMRFSSTTRSRR